MVILRKMANSLLIFSIMVSLILAGCGKKEATSSQGSSEEKIINVMGWANYLPQNVVQEFKEETGITINFHDISTNDDILAKLSVGNHGYDVVMPSLNFVEVLIKMEMLEKINKENVPNIDLIGKEFYSFDFDPNGDYFVPAYWGGEVIAVNEELVDKEIDSFEDLFDPEFENSLVAIEDPRVMLGITLRMLGYSVNSTDEQEIKEAGELLKKLKPNIKSYAGSDADRLLASGEVAAGIVYNGKIPMARKENPSIKAVIPKEGIATMWQDNFVIPKGAPHKENAEKFIDFILRPEISKEITLEQPYPSAVEEAMDLLPEDFRKEMDIIPKDQIKQESYILDVGEALKYYDQVWTSIKQ